MSSPSVLETVFSESSGLENLFTKLKSYLQPPDNQGFAFRYADSSPAGHNPNVAGRQELIAKLVSTCLGLAVSFTITYFGFRYLANVLDPTRQEKKEAQKRAERLMKRTGVENTKLTEYEMCIASNLVDPLSMLTSWEDIGGLDEVIEEIHETVLLPFTNRKLFSKSSLLQPPKGVLLYGPPGCGKTMIAKAMAKASGARFINLQMSSLTDKWYGESQKRSEAVFTLAVKIQPTIIFIDEIDSFLRSRTSSDHEATAMMKAQFMSFWDGLVTDNKSHIMIVGATNRPQDVDAAILRRMPSMFCIQKPNADQRAKVLTKILDTESVSDDVDISELARQTEGFSGSDLRELCRNAMIYRVRDFIRLEHHLQQGSLSSTSDDDEELRPLHMADLLAALHKVRKSKLVSLVAAQQIELD